MKGKNIMTRCTRTTNLEVHHKNRNVGNGINNAEVLCHDCHVATLLMDYREKNQKILTK